ncbi:glycosyltransferase [Shewanella xiamenensis]
MNEIGISIITVNYNSSIMINEIEQIVHESEDLQYIVVDNSDNFIRENNKTTIISGHGNVGFGRACNLGVHSAIYNTVLFLNPDVTLTKTFVAELRLALKSFDKKNIYGVCVDRKKQSNIFLSNIPFLLYERRYINEQQLSQAELSVTFVSGACMIMTKQRFEYLGGFDEDVFLYAEDFDLCLRNKIDNGENILLTRLQVDHIGGGTEKVGKVTRLFPAIRRLKNSILGHYVILSKKHNKIHSIITSIYLASGIVIGR